MRNVGFLEKLLDGASVEWMPLRSVADILNGYAFKSKKYSESGIRVVRISDVQKGQMSQKDLKFYPFAAKSEIERYMLSVGDLVMSLTGNCGRVAMLSDDDLPAALNQRVACLRADGTVVLTRYLFHYFDQVSFEREAMGSATGGGQKNMSTNWLGQYPVPIPCPEDPEKSLAIQAEIVRILDSFTELTAELTAELKARKQQYNYYRDQLLSHPSENMAWKPLGWVGEVRMCKRVMKNQTSADGDIPFFKIGTFGKEPNAFISRELFEEFKAKYSYPREGEVLISASGTIGRSVIFDGEEAYFQDSNIVWLENDESKVLNKYLFYYYQIAKWHVSDGGVIRRLYNDNIKKTLIAVPYADDSKKSIEEQARIVAILDKFDTLTASINEGLPREIKLRQQQYEYYRDLLLSFPKPEEAA